MRPNSASVFGSLVVAVMLSACARTTGEPDAEPLLDPAPVTVSLQTTQSPARHLPQLDASAEAGAIEVIWDLDSPSCMVANATGGLSGSTLQIQINRGGNPLADCAPAHVALRYTARASGLAAGRYEVRLVDSMPAQRLREVGRRTVTIPAGN
jgi:hypothetical protein